MRQRSMPGKGLIFLTLKDESGRPKASRLRQQRCAVACCDSPVTTRKAVKHYLTGLPC